MDYYRHSIDVILQNQHSSGAYIASPAFDNYHFCWLRDGSFIAHAMDRVGQVDSAELYFRWVDRVIQKYAAKIDLLEAAIKKGAVVGEKDILHTRFTLEGDEEDPNSGWGNFQIDGYGTWIWALAEHVRITGNNDLLKEFTSSILNTVRYLALTWQLPNYDCWEEHPEYLHPYSLAAVYGGLNTAAILESEGKISTHGLAEKRAKEIKQFLLDKAVVDGKFVKHIWAKTNDKAARPVENSGVDSSLLGLAIPYQVFSQEDPALQSTISAIEKELHRVNGGVYRYKGDVYYGGGEWLLLTAWLGWEYAQAGDIAKARALLEWIEKNASENGDMPEQVNEHTLFPQEYKPWVEKWGEVASPLLWSHAMYLILFEQLKNSSL